MTEPHYVELTAADLGPVLGYLDEIAASRTGWVNFEPAVHVEDVPPPKGGLFGLFSTHGPDVPLATWTPGETHRGRTEPTTIGILHPSGHQAAATLAERGRPVPDGWAVVQDSSKKGLVVAVPARVAHRDVVEWLLAAATALSVIPLTGEWRAAVYRP